MQITRRRLGQIIKEEITRLQEADRGRPIDSFSQLRPGIVFTVRPGRQRMGQRPRPALRLKVTSSSPHSPGHMPARVDAVDDRGRRYSMTDDTGRGTELYLVRDEDVVWSGDISAVTIERDA